ncbi:MAG TPA: hypothetical protein VGP85_11070 [Pyrinomonadaceae bacterium]|jgi:hypothetical protein|nr:hypothetical protein [Pyrinomonadaceae bacterium]
MSKTTCSTIRRQLDELMLGDAQSPDVSQHLRECMACRDFHEKQTKLRQMVGSLGTVSAPSDFDFRLRSKLASGKSNGSYQLSRSLWLFGKRTAIVAAALLIIVGAVFLIRELQNQNTVIQTAEDNRPPSRTVPAVVDSTTAGTNQDSKATDVTAKAGEKEKEKVSRKIMSIPPRIVRTLDSKDEASLRAPLIRAPQQAVDQIFPVDASQQSLRVSLFDGRGNPRTISLPTVTFGSQRVVPTATSFAPKGVW